MEQCAQCGQQGGADTIRLCSACKAIGYCSRDCQKRHWSRHKTECARTMTMDKSLHDKDSSSRQAAERETQAAEKPTSPSDDGSSVDTPLMTCHKCGLQRQDMNRCGSCREVTYCSRDCQRADWKAHKAVCRAVDQVTTVKDGKHTPKKETSKGATAQMESLSLSLSKTHLTAPLSWEEARSRAARLYPRHRIVDKFREMELDWVVGARKGMVVAVLKIGALYPHFFRQGRCLEDAEGNQSFVLFHTPEDPRPHFRYEQLCEGNFLCYEHAHMHLFLEGTVGLRIDEAKEVHVLEPRIKETSKHASPAMTTTPQQWEEARFRAQTMFPFNEVVDSLRNIDRKALKSWGGMTSTCAPTGVSNNLGPLTLESGEVKATVLVELVSPISAAFQLSWVIKDRKGKSAQVNFLFAGIPSPHFRFEDLQKGHFLCVNQPRVNIEKEHYVILATDPRGAATISV